MRAVVQRVRDAGVTVEGRRVGNIDSGLLIYLGVGQGDDNKDLEYLAQKVAGLRIFADDDGAMNRSVLDVRQSALVVSQFTLFGDVRRGKRPSFAKAMEPKTAEQMYELFIDRLEQLGVPCVCGEFGAMMDIHSVNDGPVTILLDSTKHF